MKVVPNSGDFIRTCKISDKNKNMKHIKLKVNVLVNNDSIYCDSTCSTYLNSRTGTGCDHEFSKFSLASTPERLKSNLMKRIESSYDGN